MMIQSLFEKNLFDISVLFILLVVLTPVIEELIFRKVIYNFVESKTNHILAILSSGLIFGLMHVIQYGDFLQSIPYVMMGLVFGYIYHNSRKNIFVVIGVHTINNFISWLLSVLAVYGLII
jgi:membrane protease YdiL (CAAX protease family)